MTEDDHSGFDYMVKRHMSTAMRAAGIRMTSGQETIVHNTMMPHMRRLMSVDQKRGVVEKRTATAESFNITPMEFTALIHGARGWTADQSARHLGISMDTMKTHRRRLFQRLGTSTVIETVVHALRCGILTLDDIDRES